MGSEKTVLWWENIGLSAIAWNSKIIYANRLAEYPITLEVACISWYAYVVGMPTDESPGSWEQHISHRLHCGVFARWSVAIFRALPV